MKLIIEATELQSAISNYVATQYGLLVDADQITLPELDGIVIQIDPTATQPVTDNEPKVKVKRRGRTEEKAETEVNPELAPIEATTLEASVSDAPADQNIINASETKEEEEPLVLPNKAISIFD